MNAKHVTAKLTFVSPAGDQTLGLKTSVFGGILADGSGAAMGGCTGDSNIIDTTLAMGHAIRAFLKIMVNEHNMSLEQAKGLLDEVCVKRAVELERKGESIDNIDLDTHVIAMRYERKKGGKK